jgi:hypothetical protein
MSRKVKEVIRAAGLRDDLTFTSGMVALPRLPTPISATPK